MIKVLVGVFLVVGLWGQVYLAIEDVRRFRKVRGAEGSLDLPPHRMFVALSLVGVLILGTLAWGIFDWADGEGGAPVLMAMIGKLLVFALINAAGSWFAPLIASITGSYLVYRLAQDGALFVFPTTAALLGWTFGASPDWLSHLYSVFWIGFGIFAPFYERFGLSFLRRRR